MPEAHHADASLKQHADLRRQFIFMLPAVFITYSLAYLDRTNFPERAPRNVTGEVMAMINSAGALGGFVGTYHLVGWLQSATGGPKAGFLLMSIAVILSSILILLLSQPKQAIA